MTIPAPERSEKKSRGCARGRQGSRVAYATYDTPPKQALSRIVAAPGGTSARALSLGRLWRDRPGPDSERCYSFLELLPWRLRDRSVPFDDFEAAEPAVVTDQGVPEPSPLEPEGSGIVRVVFVNFDALPPDDLPLNGPRVVLDLRQLSFEHSSAALVGSR